MIAFWQGSGLHLLEEAQDNGQLGISADLLRAYLKRPELVPPEEACVIEIGLYEALLQDPLMPVDAGRITAMEDTDAQDNWRIFVRFRDHLVKHGTIESAYLGLFKPGAPMVPPMFIDQMVHVIVHKILADTQSPLQGRAGELLFRTQKVSVIDSGMLCADEEVVEMQAHSGGFGALGDLMEQANTPVRTLTMDVLGEDNQNQWWGRSNAYDMVLDITFARPGLDALARILEQWTVHMTGVPVSIQPVQAIRDERWSWHIGLDAVATGILNDLYERQEVGDDRMASLLSLFRMEVKDDTLITEIMRGKPIYLGLAMDDQSVLRLKPQNLIVNMPLEAAS